MTGQVQQDRCWFAYGVDQIERHPWHYLSLIPAKLGYTFDHESFEVEYLHEARPSAWPEARRAAWRDGITTVHRLLVFAAALAGIAFVRRAKRRETLAQGAALVVVLALGGLAVSSDTPHFYPLVLAGAILPLLPLPGRPPLPDALMLGVALVVTTIVTHAVFFGEDRYHVVLTPIFCILAVAAFRKPAAPA